MITTKQDFIDEVCKALGQANVSNQDHVNTEHTDVFFGDHGSKTIRIETSKGCVAISTDDGDIVVKHRVPLGEDAGDVQVGTSFDGSGHSDVKAYLGDIWDQLP